MPNDADTASSAAETTDTNSPTGQEQNAGNADVNGAGSSTAETQTPEDHKAEMLKVVEDALQPEGDQEGEGASSAQDKPNDGSSASKSDGKDEAAAKQTEGDDAGDKSLSEDEQAEADAKLPFHKHPRWEQVITERRDALKEVASLTPRAEQYDRITAFMGKYDLSHKEVADGMQLMALMKIDPEKAIEGLNGYVDMLNEYLGLGELEADLKEKVSRGEMTEDAAYEVQKSRFAVRNTEARETARQQETAEETARRTQMEQANAVTKAVTTWENGKAENDPDFKRIRPQVLDRVVRLLSAEKEAATPERATELCDKALKQVKREMGTLIKPVTQQQQTNGKDQSKGGGSETEPQTSLEVVEKALAQPTAGAAA